MWVPAIMEVTIYLGDKWTYLKLKKEIWRTELEWAPLLKEKPRADICDKELSFLPGGQKKKDQRVVGFITQRTLKE